MVLPRVTINRRLCFFIMIYLCVILIAGTVVTTSYLQESRKEKQIYESSRQMEVLNIQSLFSQQFTAAINTCNSIFSVKWYTHYRNAANIYSSEFDLLKRIEIQEEINAKVTALAYISDILIITPAPLDQVICRNGWYSLGFYQDVNPNIRIRPLTSASGEITVGTVGDACCLIALNDPTPRQTRSVIGILVNKRAFADALRKVLPDTAVHVRAELCGQLLYESGAFSETLLTYSAAANLPQFTLSISSPDYEQSLSGIRRTSYFLSLVIVLLGGAVLSALITFYILRPLRQIVSRFGGNFRQLTDPYRFICQNVEACTRDNAKLSQEKADLNRSYDQFLAMMRNEILFGMLTNPRFDFHHGCLRSVIPWIDQDYPLIMVLLGRTAAADTAVPQMPELEDVPPPVGHTCIFTLLTGDICVLVWFENKVSAEAAYPWLEGQMTRIASHTDGFAVSDVITDMLNLHSQYLKLMAIIEANRPSRLDLPLTWQLELVRHLQANHLDECLQLLDEGRLQTKPAAVFNLLMHIAKEYGLPPLLTNLGAAAPDDHPARDPDEARWDMLKTMAGELCQSINQRRHTGLNESARSMIGYIHEHYNDPDLCMKQLSDRFSIHRSLISRILKEQLGITFSDYLLRLRIDQAMKLLKTSDLAIEAVGDAVGYENYLTFKRAFIRCNGLSPREYRSSQY